jgi:hypothetical protein
MAEASASESLREVDERLADWRQGDCVVGDEWFLHRFDPAVPLTAEAADAAAGETDLCETPVRGLVVLTQTCDLVRSYSKRPYVEVAPLVEVDAAMLRDIRACRRPAYAFIPGLEAECLVADLDRTMTVEKAVVARWDRVPGCLSDGERRDFGRALARKLARVAFPDDFVRLAKPLSERLAGKYGADTDEGGALRALREIRVRAAPSWDASHVEVFLWFIRHDSQAESDGTPWPELLRKWLGLLSPSGRFMDVDGAIVGLDDLTARDYVESDPLDLDRLS